MECRDVAQPILRSAYEWRLVIQSLAGLGNFQIWGPKRLRQGPLSFHGVVLSPITVSP